MTFISYAQNFEDVLLWRALKSVEQGFYIDVGAAHPDVDSVTRAFYERGWRGINVEPVEDYVRLLRASRPRDLTLDLALSDSSEDREFYLVPGTGLSTVNGDIMRMHQKIGMMLLPTRVHTDTLANVCAKHVDGDIHFLKIDVEGAERDVLLGADFSHYRPWIVIVEATLPNSQQESHAEWEPILLQAEYRPVWFDGLNRYYVAAERYPALGRHFRIPPNVFDDFLRSNDSIVAQKIAASEMQAKLELARRQGAEDRSVLLAAAVHDLELQAAQSRIEAREANRRASRAEGSWGPETPALGGMVELAQRATLAVADALQLTRTADRRTRYAEAWLTAIIGSRSWQLTRPARAIMRRVRGHAGGALPILSPQPVDDLQPDAERIAALAGQLSRTRQARVQKLRWAIHQFHSGSALGDAITQGLLHTRGLLRSLGYTSEIFVEHRDEDLAHELHLFDELPEHDDYVLLLHHSTGYDVFERVISLRAPKVLVYHNITPSAFLSEDPVIQRYASLGRSQLDRLRDHVAAAIAVSDYNALDLRKHGFEAPFVCNLLFDLERLQARARRTRPRHAHGPFTILFVGRIIESKAQKDLVEAFASLRTLTDRPCRLVLVGRTGSATDTYRKEVERAIENSGASDSVLLTGLVTDNELHDWYARADVYLSLSHHEGFGVPLIEAIAHGVPVLAWPSGAIGHTLGDPSGLLADRSPRSVAGRLLELMNDQTLGAELAERQSLNLGRFDAKLQIIPLLHALAFAGAAPVESEAFVERISTSLRFTIMGHLNGTYSLAAINRAIALGLESARPGTVRVVPVETVVTKDLSKVPAGERRQIVALADRPPHASSPEIVISQHYPVYVPPDRGDARMALFFWEESLIPGETIALLNLSFDAVLAPSQFVAKVLRDSGLALPVHVVGQAPAIDAFRRLRQRTGNLTTFLHVSSCFPRKGIDALLAAWAKAFRAGDPVRLVIKGFPNPHNEMPRQVAEVTEIDSGIAPIEVIDRDMDDAELLDLYANADVVVLPTRGEGFNLPAAETMAAGLPLIVTGYGGHMDYCNSDSARLVDYEFALSESHLATAHSVWADPDVDDLVAALQELAGSAVTRASLGSAGRDVADSRFNRNDYVDRLIETSLRVLLTPPRRPARIGWISTWNVRCGVAEYSRHLVENFPANDDVTSLTVFADQRSARTTPNAAGVAVLPSWEAGQSNGVRDMVNAVGRVDPDLLVIQHQPGLIGWSHLIDLIGECKSRIVIVVLHNIRDAFDLDHLLQLSLRSALRQVSRVFVHSVADLNVLKDWGLVANVTLMPHGALAPLEAKTSRDLHRAKSPMVGCYGFFLPDKGIAELIEAMAIVRKSWPTARLRLVNADYGSPESNAEIVRCHRRADELGLADAIEWQQGFVPDSDSLQQLAACDLIVLPYRRSKEASSAAVRIAMAAGPAVLVSDLPVFQDAGEAVARMQGTSPTHIADGILGLFADAEARGRVQERARKWVLDRDWTVIARRMQGVMLGLVAQRDATRTPARSIENRSAAEARTAILARV